MTALPNQFAAVIELHDLRTTVAALRAELASYRQLPLVPQADYARSQAALKQALEAADAASAEIERLRDKRQAVVAASDALDIERARSAALRDALAEVMRTLDRAAGDPHENKVWAHARGVLAGSGEP